MAVQPLIPKRLSSRKLPLLAGAALLLAGLAARAEHTLANGSHLLMGQGLVSANGRFQLEFRTDGKLAVYRLPDPGAGAGALRTLHWESSRPGFTGPGLLAMEADNNLVAYGSDRKPRWHSGTHHPVPQFPAQLTLTDDGTPCVHDGKRILWDSSKEAATLQPGDAVTVRIILTKKEIREAIAQADAERESKCVVQ